MSNPHDYTVGWICAIATEYVAAQAFLDEKHDGPVSVSTNDNNNYTLGKIGKHNVVIAVLPHGEYGISSAASVARDMLHSFPNVRIGLMVGIGGGAPSRKHDIRLGDVVVSASGNSKGGVFQYDFGKAIQDQDFQETGFLNQPPPILRAAVNGLMAQYEGEGHQFDETINSIFEKKPRLRKKYRRPELSTDRLYQPGVLHSPNDESSCATACGNDPSTLVVRPERAEDEENPSIHYGLIASADRLMKDALIRDALAKKHDVLCFEMEAAGLMNHFPCLVIRGICDYSDTHKHKEWQGYAAMTAAAYAKDLLYKIAPSRVENETRLSQLAQSVREIVDYIQIRNWLAPPDPSTNLNQARSLHYKGTGQWFLDSDVYSEWKKDKNSFLWLNGIPGCGKTILSSTIITDLGPTNSNPKVLYFFFNFNDVEKRSLENAIRSLIFQLSSKHRILRSDVDAVYSSFGNGTRQPDAPALDKLLRRMMQKSEEIYIILDALDESERHSGSYSSKSLLDWIKDLHDESTNIHILVTSRPEQHITASFNGWAHTDKIIQLQSGLVSDDITAYTKARVSEMPRWTKRPDIQAEIETTILKKAGGMFRWVSCQFDTLEQCLDPPSVRRELQNLPKTLDATYAQIWQRINPNQLSTAKRLLQFLMYSERPLKLDEAVDVIAVNPSSQPAFTPENRMPIPEEIIRYCSSLVILARKSVQSYQLDTDTVEQITEIQLAHFSVKEYLLSDRLDPDFAEGLDEISAKASIVDVCLSYLLAIHKLCSPLEARQQYHLTEFSAQYWMKHAKDVESSYEAIIPSVKRYFLCQNAFQFGCQVDDLYMRNVDRIPALYYASLWGLPYSSIFLLQKGADINAQGGEYGNALQATLAGGHLEMAQMLLEKGADINAQDGYFGNALQTASVGGYLEMAEMLLEKGADINAQGGEYGNALQAASEEGHLEMAQMLLEKGADINAQGGKYGNALQAALARGHLEMAEMLLEKGADINAQGGEYGNALQAAAAEGYLEMAQMLIQNGADINAQGGEYGNTLQAASEEGHLEMAQMLLEKGADINAQGGKYGNALQAALARGHLEMAEMLLEKGADINAQGGFYGNALQAASARGHLEMAEMLLEKGADINAQGGEYGNALQAAAAEGYLEMAEMLLEKGADINAQGGFYGNALQAASAWGRLEMAEMLIEKGADINAQGGVYGNALQAALAEGHLEMAEMLLEKGADINAQGGFYGNALQAASARGHLEMAEMLLEKGADINAQGGKYGNALQAASAWGRLEMAEMLIEKGADINAQGGEYGNTLQAASAWGHLEMAQMLLEKGADINAQDGYFGNAL
uniref:protein S-acyltransferase n=1 Tax=Bionectria ochroleuca TaxID=29856 RepID=A0A8H7NI02_BIOOC